MLEKTKKLIKSKIVHNNRNGNEYDFSGKLNESFREIW